MNKEEFRARTKRFAVDVISFARTLPREVANDVICKQLVRSATSVAANYRSVCRATSRQDAISKFGIVEEEADEACFWLELLEETGYREPAVQSLKHEANELVALSVASIRTMKQNMPTTRSRKE